MGVLMKHINEPPPPVPNLHPALQAVIDRALAKSPADRFQTPLEMARALEAAMQKVADSPTVMPSIMRRAASGLTPGKGGRRLGALPFVLGLGLILMTAAVFLIFRPDQPAESLPTLPAASPAAEATLPPATEAHSGPEPGQTIALLRFQDGAAKVDEVTVTALDLPLPPEGQQYEAWLVGQSTESRRSLGLLALDADGAGKLTFVDEQGRNLLERYDTLELRLEPSPDPSPNPSETLAYSLTLPSESLAHVRHQLVAFPITPANNGLVDGLLRQTSLLNDLSQEMLAASANGDAAGVRRNAEGMLNVLVGGQSEDHRDWDADGTALDPGDGFGLLLNGDSPGYIQGSADHSSYAANAADATQNMIVHGTHVETCTHNMEGWAPQLRDLLKQVLQTAGGTAELEPMVRQAAALANEMLEGTDLNGNEQIEPVPGEGGARTAYQHAFYMADISIQAP
jgi:hypothetical protein